MNPYEPTPAELKEIIIETSLVRTFVVTPKHKFHFKPGQFVQLTVPGVGEAPFTPSSSPNKLKTLEFTVKKEGRVTKALFESPPGTLLGLRGPYGVPYPLEMFKGKYILIVGEGTQVAFLRSLFLTLLENIEKFKEINFYYGANSPRDVVYLKQFEEWEKLEGVRIKVTVKAWDEVWKGKIGTVVDLLEKCPFPPKKGVAVISTPLPTMELVVKKLLEFGFYDETIYLSMERNMSCGIGKCGHCRLGNLFLCKDGPVLTWDKIKDIKNLFL